MMQVSMVIRKETKKTLLSALEGQKISDPTLCEHNYGAHPCINPYV
jgi:hypothetical protein